MTLALTPRPVGELSDAELEAEARHLLAREDAHGRATPGRWPTPGALAQDIDRSTIQTRALRLIDSALVDVERGDCDRLIICMPPQQGKQLAHDTLVPTPRGWIRHGDLQVGDEVFHPTGRPIRVTWLSEESLATRRVTFTDGTSIDCHERHEWTLYDRGNGRWRTVETRYLETQKLRSGPAGRGGRFRFQLPHRDALELPAADLPVDPWTFGLWLGDGSTNKGCITHHADDVHDVHYEVGAQWTHATTGVITTSYRGLRDDLERTGALHSKHIPDTYLWASEQARWDLLCGLVDSDGYIDKSGQCSFANTNLRLALGVRQLVRSLGYRAGIYTTDPKTSSSGIVGTQPVHVVQWTPHDGRFPSRLPRKAKAAGPRVRRRIAVATVEHIDPRPGRCISVDSPDGQYLAGEGMLPTHNSTRVTKFGPLWMLTRNPERRIVVVSYGADLAQDFGRDIRGMVTGNQGQDGSLDLGLRIAPDNGAASSWRIAGHRGGVRSIGIGGGITGRPADALFIDDPLANREQAESEKYRNRAKNFWTSTGSTRLAPGAPVVLVLTRWHEEDLAGWLLGRPDGHRWRVLNIPAQADHRPEEGETDPLGRRPGEYMDSARLNEHTGEPLSADDWEQIKVQSGPQDWNALFQGRPAPPEGVLFKRGAWSRYSTPLAVPRADGSVWVPPAPGDQLAQSWDMAFKATSGSDYVVGQVWLKRGHDLYLLDMVRARLTFTETVQAVRDLSARWPQAITKLVEDKANGTAVLDSLRNEVVGLTPVEPEGGKVARANAAAPLVVAGNVHLPDVELLPVVAELVDEAASFPSGKHDDAVDALTQAVLALVINPLIGEARVASPTGLRIGGGGGGRRLGGLGR